MQILLLCMGRTDETEIKVLIDKYEKRLPSNLNYKRIEINEPKFKKNTTQDIRKNEEFELFKKHIPESSYIVLFDEKGRSLSSKDFAKFINHHQIISTKNLVFCIGGPYGFSTELKKLANQKISLSAMTFTHQMVRLFVTEQIYRAYSIIQGKKYHHD